MSIAKKSLLIAVWLAAAASFGVKQCAPPIDETKKILHEAFSEELERREKLEKKVKEVPKAKKKPKLPKVNLKKLDYKNVRLLEYISAFDSFKAQYPELNIKTEYKPGTFGRSKVRINNINLLKTEYNLLLDYSLYHKSHTLCLDVLSRNTSYSYLQHRSDYAVTDAVINNIEYKLPIDYKTEEHKEIIDIGGRELSRFRKWLGVQYPDIEKMVFANITGIQRH